MYDPETLPSYHESQATEHDGKGKEKGIEGDIGEGHVSPSCSAGRRQAHIALSADSIAKGAASNSAAEAEGEEVTFAQGCEESGCVNLRTKFTIIATLREVSGGAAT